MSETPLLLLPLRLETAFVGSPSAPILRVRIVPDEVHLASDRLGGASTDLLPERFTIQVRVGGQTLHQETAELVDVLEVTPNSPWLTDFPEAVRVGLGVEITLPAGTTAIDDVIAVGVSRARPAQAAERIRQHLLQRAKRNEVEFVPVGTPTNNTHESRAGSPRARRPERASTTKGSISSGSALAAALGLAARSLDVVPGAAAPSPADHLPAIRVGRQVYGVLRAEESGRRVAKPSPTPPTPSTPPAQAQSGIRLGAWGTTGGLTRRTSEATGGLYELAPSPHHAVTASVLGSAQSQVEDRFAISLGGHRGRAAVALAAAQRSGRQIGDVLGARIEAALLESATSDPSVLPLLGTLRRRFPLRDAGTARCDGLALAEKYGDRLAGVRSPLHALIRGQHTETALHTLAVVLDEVLDAVDALADLAIAESVHQFVAGRYERAGAAADLLTPGDLNTGAPERFEVLTGEASGTPLTQRVILALPGKAVTRPSGWSKTSPRARLAPVIDAVLAATLGKAGELKFAAIDRDGLAVGACTVAQLDVAALDFAALTPEALTALVAALIVPETDRDRVTDVIAVDEHTATAWSTARAWHQSLSRSRPLTDADLLSLPPDPTVPDPALAPVLTEIAAAFRDLADSTAPSREELVGFGLPLAASPTALAARVGDLERLSTSDPVAAARACFGGEAIIEGRATVSLPPAAPASTDVDAWLDSVSHVRPAIAAYRAAGIGGSGGRTVQHPATPYAAGQGDPTAWAGAEFDGVLTGAVTASLIVGLETDNTTTTALPMRNYAGVLLDEWVEVIPHAEAIGAVALHLNSPNSRAPQAAILAQPRSSAWSDALVLDLVEETMAKVTAQAATAGDPAADLEELLAARVRDPLWFLVRQQQLGELDGEDAGWPVAVDWDLDHLPLSAWDVTSPAAGWDARLLSHQASTTAGGSWSVNMQCDAADGADAHVYAFAAKSSTRRTASKPGRRTHQRALPSPVRFAGMPADRYWEMEDAELSLAMVELGETNDDLVMGRLALIEFATRYGNDWFTVPVSLPRGAVSQLSQVVVTDSFGRTETLQPTDAGRSIFAPSGDVLLVPPPASASILAGPVESTLRLVVDEAANLVWAIPGGSGPKEGAPLIEALPIEAPPSTSRTRRFRVAAEVPDGWYPFTLSPDGDTLEAVRDTSSGPPLVRESASLGVARSALGEHGSTIELRWLMARGPRGERWVWQGHAVEHVTAPIRLASSFDTLT